MKAAGGRQKADVSLALSLLLAGCSILGSRTKSNIYSLERIAPAAPVARRGAPVSIDAIELPPGFDRKEIVVRKADQQLDVRETDQWSASLEPLVLHTLAFDLAARLPEGTMILPGQTIPAGATRGIDVAFAELAAGPGNSFVLDAQWMLRESGRAAVAHHERIEIPVDSLASANVAGGLSRALAALADRIAAAM